MKISKLITVLGIAAMLSIALVGCGGGQTSTSTSTSADVSAAASPVEQLSSVSGATVHLSADNPTASVNVEVADGEALVIMARIDEGDTMQEVKVSTYKGGEWFSDDSFYGGSGCAESEVEPGSYTIEIDGAGAAGTMWVFAHPAGSIDYENTETDEIIDSILAQIS